MKYKQTLIQREALQSFIKAVQALQAMFPENTDLERFRVRVIELQKQRKPVSFEVKGLSATLQGEKFSLCGLGATELTLEQQIDNLINASADEADAYVKQTEMMMKAQTAQVVESVGSAASSIATLFGPVGAIVSVAIQVVTIAVSLFVMFGWNPCEGAFYKADDIRVRLQKEFAPSYVRVMKSIKKNFEQGSVSFLEGDFNELLKEIDLGVYSYELELRTHGGNKCSVAALQGFTRFVATIKENTNRFYNAIEGVVKDFYKFVEIETEAYLTERSWYFIVPVTHHKNERAKYRKIRLERWNENAKAMYPYGSEVGFDTWLRANVIYFNSKYSDGRAKQYEAEMVGFRDKIKAIREDFYLSVLFKHAKEDELRKQQYQIYLKYDTDYAKSLEKSAKNKVEAYNFANESFLKELKQIRENNLKAEQRRLDNVLAIAQDNADRKAKLQQKQLITLGAIAVGGYIILKQIK